MPVKIKSEYEATYFKHDQMLSIDSWANGINLEFTRNGKVVALNFSFNIVIDYPIKDKSKLHDSLKSLFAGALDEVESELEKWLITQSKSSA